MVPGAGVGNQTPAIHGILGERYNTIIQKVHIKETIQDEKRTIRTSSKTIQYKK